MAHSQLSSLFHTLGGGGCVSGLLLILFTLLLDNNGEKGKLLTRFLFMVLCASLIYRDATAARICGEAM